MNNKTYRVDAKRLSTEQILSVDVRAIRKNKVISKVNVELEIFDGLVFTDNYHSFQYHIDTKERNFLAMTAVPVYRVDPRLQDANHAFSNMRKVKEIDATPFQVAQLSVMSGMFMGCLELEYINLTGVDTSKVLNFGNLCYNCKALGHIDGVFDLSSIKKNDLGKLNSMFYSCPSTLKVNFKNVPANFFDKVKGQNDSRAVTGPERMGLKNEQVVIVG